MAVLQLTDKVSEKGRQVYKVVSCTVYGDHLQNKPLLTRGCERVVALFGKFLV